MSFPAASSASSSLDDLETPALVADLARVERNLDRAAEYARAHGLALRPHVKTHKAPEMAAEQLRRGAAGLTCATPREAEVMSAVGGDLLVAYPPVGAARVRRLLALPAVVRLTVALDSLEAVESLAAEARRSERAVRVYVELDTGMRRVGVQDDAALVALARAVRAHPPLELAGLAFYPGHVRAAAADQGEALAAVSARLDRAVAAMERGGVAPEVVSGGSTPTLARSHEMARVTEIRPGTYVYNDRTTATIGACAWDDCALTVLATVVSTAVPGQAVIDAGSKALGREPLRGAGASQADGFGALLDRPEVVVTGLSEEHGILDLSSTTWRPQVGDRVRVVPNHGCIAVHLFDTVHALRDERRVGSWAVAARGR